MSSAAAEIYAAANATFEALNLSYVTSEMGLEVPLPIVLQMDNAAAEIFCKNSAFKSNLKHIDCRQEWVRVLRNKKVLTPTHVDTKVNRADMFTKVLPLNDFERLRDLLMRRRSWSKVQGEVFDRVGPSAHPLNHASAARSSDMVTVTTEPSQRQCQVVKEKMLSRALKTAQQQVDDLSRALKLVLKDAASSYEDEDGCN